MEAVPRSVFWVAKKVLGVILILLVPIAVALPGIPGDVMFVTGVCLLSDRLSRWVMAVIKQHKRLISIAAVLWAMGLWGYWGWRFFMPRFSAGSTL